jgi:hypothetical protein
VDQADILQDLAEGLFLSGDDNAARQRLQEVEELIGSEYLIVPGEPMPQTELPSEHFWPLGKVERLRGKMAFTQGRIGAGLQHYILAYAYYERFSPDAVEKEDMVESLYNYLYELPVEQQQQVLELARIWVGEHGLEMEVGALLETLDALLGV